MSINAMKTTGALQLFNTEARQPNVAPAVVTEAAPVVERVRSKVWANVGVPSYETDANGEYVLDKKKNRIPNGFVYLPINLGIDTMRKREYPWRAGRKLSPAQVKLKDEIDASNLLLEILQGAAAKMEEDSSNVLSEFVVVLQRLPDDVDPDEQDQAPEENSRTAQISRLFGSM